MTTLPENQYDLFISFADGDQKWVESELLPRLERKGLRVCLPSRDFAIGVPELTNIEQSIDNSRHTLVIITPEWLESGWNQFELLLTGAVDPAARQRRLIPLLLKPCTLPRRISMLTYADFTDSNRFEEEIKRLFAAVDTGMQVFISYKRNAEPDESLARRLSVILEEAGHKVYIDQKLLVGTEWAKEIHRQIEASDCILVLLSAASVQSEMVAEEVAHAQKHNATSGKARLIPIRVNYQEPLPYQLSHALEKLHYAEWQSGADDDQLFRQLLDAISQFAALQLTESSTKVAQPEDATAGPNAPPPYADPRFIESLHDPGGAISALSEFYIKRAEDDSIERELAKAHGTTTTIRAPRQSGKSSLLLRGIAQAKERGYKVVFIDFQPLEDKYLASLDLFLNYFANLIVRKLRLDPLQVEKAWQDTLAASDKLTYLMEDYILPEAKANVVLALDEVDRLLNSPFQDNFFGLLRSWHNNRAQDERWDAVDIILVISTEPHLMISDVNQSPFNVGLKLRLQDFNEAQVYDLNKRYRSPLNDVEIEGAVKLLGGHPYLTQKALYTLVNQPMKWNDLYRIATIEQSPFGDHLRRYLWLLHNQPDLRDALKQLVRVGACPDDSSYYRLLQAGLIQGTTRTSCHYRCKLYEEYLDQKI